MSKTILTIEQEKEIIGKYLSGRSKHSLHLEYGVSEGTIRRALIRNNIHVRQVAETNVAKYYINHSFFNKDNLNENSAYVLGLIASDGGVDKKENRVFIELKSDDREILEKVNAALENERPVKTYPREGRNNTSLLYFYSKQIKQDLAYFDIIPNKTYNVVNFAKNIPEEYFLDFVRGFFDGDGCITHCNSTLRWQIDGTSLETFQTIQSRMLKYGVELKIREEPDKRSTIKKYRLYSKVKCKKIFELLYKNPNSLRMKRKYEKFQTLLMNKIPRDCASSKEEEKIC